MIDEVKSKFANRVLFIFALAISLFELIYISNLFNAYLIRDDFLYLDMAPLIRQNPFMVLTATCIGWWRPLSFLLPNLLYLIFGLNPLAFHISAFLIHLATGLMLFLLARKLFNSRIALVSYILFFTAPIIASDIGWTLGAFGDEIASFFFLVALFTALRKENTRKRHPYYLPALLLMIGSFFKITWLGVIPGLLFIDWLNYKQAPVKERLIRFLPFTFIFPLLVINYLIIGSHLTGSIQPMFLQFYNPKNLILGVSLPFIRLDVLLDEKHAYGLRMLLVLPFLVLPLLLARNKTKTIILLFIVFFGLFAVLGFNPLFGDPWGWLVGWHHLTPLVAIASILLAVIIVNAAGLIHNRYVSLSVIIVVLGLMDWSSLAMKEILKHEVLSEEAYHRNNIRNFIKLTRSFPKGTHVYILAKKYMSVNLLSDLAKNCSVTLLLPQLPQVGLMHNYDKKSNQIIFDTRENLEMFIKNELPSSNSKLIYPDVAGNWYEN